MKGKGTSERAGSVQAWLGSHQDAARRSLARRLHAPVETIMLVAVLGFILALPAWLWLLLDSARSLTAVTGHQPRIAVYLDPVGASQLAHYAAELAALPAVLEVRSMTAEQAWDAYRADLPDPSLLDWLEENPLPAVLDVFARELSPGAAHALVAEVQARLPQAQVVSDQLWVQQIYALHQAGARLLLILVGLLGTGIVLILAIASATELRERREEIEITRIMGACDRFLRRPSLYSGVWLGLGSGILASMLVAVALAFSQAPLQRAAEAYNLPLQVSSFNPGTFLTLLAIGVALGWIGARIGSSLALR